MFETSSLKHHNPSADLPENYETNEGTNSRRAKHPDDILVLVKEYIASANLAQLPLLVLTPESRQVFRLSTDRTFGGANSICVFFCVSFLGGGGYFFLSNAILGIMAIRPVNPKVQKDWRDLAGIFVCLLGGNPTSQQAAAYLTSMANGTLPANELPRLRWHEEGNPVYVMPQAREEPHPVVLATLCPSVALRAVWKRRG